MGKRRFWASVSGDASTEAGRGASNHIRSHTRGWNHGIRVMGFVNQHGRDQFEIYTTGGSNDASTKKLVAIVDADKIIEVGLLDA
jgi:hypothetical protein